MYQQKNQQKGGNAPAGDDNVDNVDNEEYASITSDNDAINHIKELINNELTNLKNNQSGGGCECEKPMTGGKKKAKVAAKGKGRKLSRSQGVETSSSSSTTNDDSSSDDSSDSENGVNSNSSLHNSESQSQSQSESGVSSSQSETMSSQNGGLSIFPFNSSEVRSSRSEKNMKMIRRKI
jgi:uncharacterized protein (DUF779 family)